MAEETKIIRIVVDSSRAVDGSRSATAALEKMQQQLDQSRSAMERMEGGLGRIGGLLKAQIALHVAELGSRLVMLGKQAFDAAAGMQEMADQMGITAQALQALQFSAVQNGMKLEQLETGIAKFSQKMGEAAGGSKEMIEALDNIGVKILGTGGKLRDTEALLEDVAKAITSIDEPAKQTAAAVDFFGKAGAKMIPMLKDIADGMDELRAKTKAAGAMISDEAIAKLDVVADRSSVAGLRWRALLAEIGAPIAAAGLQAINTMLGELLSKLLQLKDFAGGFAREQSLQGAQENLGELQKRFADQRARVEALERDPNALNTTAPQYMMDRLRGKPAQVIQADLAKERAKAEAILADLKRAEGRLAMMKAGPDQQVVADLVSGTFPPTRPLDDGGTSNPAAKGGGGQTPEDKYRQLEQQLVNTATAQKAMTGAALAGNQAFDEAKATVDAQNKVLGIFGQQLADNDPRLVRIRDLLLDIERNKAAESFALSTKALEQQNQVLEAENRLMGATNEQRAVEIALIKSRQDAEKAGAAVTAEMEEARRSAIENNERLKSQGDEMKKANDMWLQPLKSGLESIQRGAADMWEKILENGKFSMAEFGQLFAKTARSAAAQLLALATIRPVISFVVQGLGSLGLVSPGTASALGYGSSGLGALGGMLPGGGGATGGVGSGGGVGGLGGLGGFGNSLTSSLGSFGTWLNTPFIGGMSGVSPLPAGAFGPAPNIAGGGLTPLGAFTGLASMGFGAYNLFSSKSTAGKIGGGLGMLGGAMGIAGALLPAMSALGPIGMAVGLLGGLLPSLFGGGEKEVPPMPPLDYGAGVIWPTGTGFGYSGNTLNGGKSMSAGAESIGNSLTSLFSRSGLKTVAGSLIGGDIASGVNNSWNGQQWQGTPYTQIGLHTPQGYERITYNDTSRTAEQAADLLIAKMFSANVLRGGVTGASDSLKTAVSTAEPTTAKAVQDLVDFVNIYDKLGKTSNATADALKAVDDKFASITESATKYGLSLAPVDKAKADEKLKIATDFADGIQRALDDIKDPTKGQMADLWKEYQAMLDTNAEMVKANIGAQDQILNIERLYLAKRKQIVGDELDPNKLSPFQNAMNDIRLDTSLMGKAPIARTIVGWNREAAGIIESAKSQFGSGSPEYYQAQGVAMQQLAARMKQASDDFIGGLKDMVAQLESPGAASMGQLMKQRAADLATAMALDGPAFDGLFAVGENVKQAMKAWNAKIFKVADDFQFSISQGLLEFSNPLQAQINELNKQKEEALKTAKASNDAVQKINDEYYNRISALDKIEENNRWSVKEINEGAAKANRALTEVEQKRVKDLLEEADLAKQVSAQVSAEVASLGNHYVSISDVTELFLQKEKALREQYYAQALGSLDDLIKRLRYGDLSGASPEAKLSGVSGSYAAALAQVSANPYDQNALSRFASIGAEYSSELRSYYGSTTSFYAQNADILQNAQTFANAVRTSTATGTDGKVDPVIASMAQQIAELTAVLTAERQSRAESDEAVRDLALQVRRLVTGRQAA